jgi:hypothetical protein
MRATSKFFRHRNGISSFAVVGVETAASSTRLITWLPAVAIHEQEYRGAVANGIAIAFNAHRATGGGPVSFQIVELVELLVDTKEDAVQCAATAAAWMALGHGESEITYEFDGRWHASIFFDQQVGREARTLRGRT